MQYTLKTVSFDTILPIWEQNLWSSRESAIKTHSSMTWPFDNDVEYDMEIYKYPATYWALLVDDKIIGVNSGHKTSDTQYRSRGLWVDEKFRKKGLAQIILTASEQYAKQEKCKMIWTVPRKTALVAYTKCGFNTVGNYFRTETSEANIYAYKHI